MEYSEKLNYMLSAIIVVMITIFSHITIIQPEKSLNRIVAIAMIVETKERRKY